jgi:hypothetical protein
MITTYDWNHGTVMNMKEARRMNTGIDKGQVEHKYDYSANQFDVRAWGWSSTSNHVGIWFVNPSVEYLSGGPTKVELSAHRDATFNTNALDAPAPPTLLNYWRGSHYGGSICNIAADRCVDQGHRAVHDLLQFRAGRTMRCGRMRWRGRTSKPAQMALRLGQRRGLSAQKRTRHRQRQNCFGRSAGAGLKMGNLLVGLSAPDYAPATIPRNFGGGGGGRRGGRGGGGGGFGLAGGGEDEAAMTNQNSFSGGTNENSAPQTSAAGLAVVIQMASEDSARTVVSGALAVFGSLWNKFRRRLWPAAHRGLAERREELRVLGARQCKWKFLHPQRPRRHLHPSRDCRRRPRRIDRDERDGCRGRNFEPRRIWTGSPSATAGSSGTSASRTAPAPNSSKATIIFTRAYSSSAAKNCGLRKSGQSVGVMTSSA